MKKMKMKKKIKKVESDAVRDKQQQERERVADDVVDSHSNQFPNFMALTEEEKLAFFESLHAARKNVIDSGNKITGRFGTVHDEYLKYFGSAEDNEGGDNIKDSSETLECSGTYDSVSSSLQSASSRSTYSAIPRRTMAKPIETIFIHMNMSANSSSPSIMSLKNSQESKSLLSKEDEERQNSGSRNNPTQPYQTQTKSPKRKRPRDNNSDKVKNKSSSRFATKLPKLKKTESPKAQKDERKSEMSISNKSHFKILKSDEREIFFSTLKEARDNILKESPDKDNEILSMKNMMKKYEKPKEVTPMKMKMPCRKETCIKGNIKGKTNNLRVKVVITSSESGRIKKERVSRRKERSRKWEKERVEGEKEKTRKGTGMRAEKDNKCKTTERKLVRSTDGIRKKRQRQDNLIVSARKPKENKKENARTQIKGDFIKGTGKVCKKKKNKEEGNVLDKSERSVIESPGGKQDKKKIVMSRRKIEKDKLKEKTERLDKERSPNSEQVEKDKQSVLAEEKEEEVAEEVKEDSRSSEEGMAKALKAQKETIKTEAEATETFFFVDKFKYSEEVEDEGKDNTEETKKINKQLEDSMASKSFQNEFGEEVKCLEVESVDDRGATLSMGTTDEEITIELEEEISITKTPLSVKSEVRYQPEHIEPDVKRKRHTEKSKSLSLELRLEGESLDNCYAGKANSQLVTSDEDSVLQLWEELKLLKLSDSDCVMETETMTAQMGNENISETRFTFLSNIISPNKVHLAEEKLFVVGSENKIQEGGIRREAAVLDLLESEGVILVDGDAIEKIKNLVEALEKEAETEGGTKQEMKPDKKNIENEYNHLLLEYIDYLTRLLYMLTNKREQVPKIRVSAPLMAPASHPAFVKNKNKKADFIKKPQVLSDTNLLKGMKTESEVKAKESAIQESEIEGDPSSLSPFSDSPITGSSYEDDVSLVTTPSTRKKLIEDFVRERAKFVEESIDGFRIIKMPSRGCEVDNKLQGQEAGQNRTKFKFFHIFSRFCKCVKKKGSEEDQSPVRQQRTGGKEESDYEPKVWKTVLTEGHHRDVLEHEELPLYGRPVTGESDCPELL